MAIDAFSGDGVRFADRPVTWEEIVVFARQLEAGRCVSPADAMILVRLVLRFQRQLVGGPEPRGWPCGRA
jgi:hypothetical protein